MPGLAELLEGHAELQLLDVRGDDEWAESRIPGSTHMPYHDLIDAMPDLDRALPVAAICSSGKRAAMAVGLLQRGGFADVIHVTHGGVKHLGRAGPAARDGRAGGARVSAPEVSAAEVAEGLAGDRWSPWTCARPTSGRPGTSPRATWISMTELAGRLDELPRDRTLAIVCRSGSRSGVVADHLHDAGYDAVNLAGGMYAWVAAGLPIQPEDGWVA